LSTPFFLFVSKPCLGRELRSSKSCTHRPCEPRLFLAEAKLLMAFLPSLFEDVIGFHRHHPPQRPFSIRFHLVSKSGGFAAHLSRDAALPQNFLPFGDSLQPRFSRFPIGFLGPFSGNFLFTYGGAPLRPSTKPPFPSLHFPSLFRFPATAGLLFRHNSIFFKVPFSALRVLGVCHRNSGLAVSHSSNGSAGEGNQISAALLWTVCKRWPCASLSCITAS